MEGHGGTFECSIRKLGCNQFKTKLVKKKIMNVQKEHMYIKYS